MAAPLDDMPMTSILAACPDLDKSRVAYRVASRNCFEAPTVSAELGRAVTMPSITGA
jgi:hypothetical protein